MRRFLIFSESFFSFVLGWYQFFVYQIKLTFHQDYNHCFLTLQSSDPSSTCIDCFASLVPLCDVVCIKYVPNFDQNPHVQCTFQPTLNSSVEVKRQLGPALPQEYFVVSEAVTVYTSKESCSEFKRVSLTSLKHPFSLFLFFFFNL